MIPKSTFFPNHATALITTEADDPLKIYIYIFSEKKITLDISSELFAMHKIHMQCHVLLSLKNNKVNLRMLSTTNLFEL